MNDLTSIKACGGAEIVAVSDGGAIFVLDLSKRELMRKIGLNNEAGDRYCLSADGDFLLMCSWAGRANLMALRKGKDLVSKVNKGVDQVDYVEHHKAFLLRGQNSCLLSLGAGAVCERWDGFRVWFHPKQDNVLLYSGKPDDIHLTDIKDEKTSSFRWKSFGVLSVAWARDSVLVSSPEGHLVGFSLAGDGVIMDMKDSRWFNIVKIYYSIKQDTYFGVASGWNGKSDYAVLKIDIVKNKVEPTLVMPFSVDCAFLPILNQMIDTGGNCVDLVKMRVIAKGIFASLRG